MSEELQQQIAALLKRNRQLIADTDADRARLREDARRAQASIRRAQAALRRAGVNSRSAA
jgi:hypothetical protein